MIGCIIASGGSGTRFDKNAILPKQYTKLADGEEIFLKTLNTFNGEVDKVVAVIREEDEEFFKQNYSKINYVYGGEVRQTSIRNGLEYFKQHLPETKYILITDAVRPFVSKAIIQNIIYKLQSGERAVIPAIKVYDTIKEVKNGLITKTINREGLYFAQTPQGFEFDTIFKLHQKYKGENFTDDSLLCEKEGIAVSVIEGESTNIKITTKLDTKL